MRGFVRMLMVVVSVGACAPQTEEVPPPLDFAETPQLEEQQSGTQALLQAVSIVSERIVWVSGHEGTILRTTNGGATWEARSTPSGDSLQFRDIHGFNGERAVAMTAGTGDLSRIYRTQDGGMTWSLVFTMPEPEGFLDCLDFLDEGHGFVYGDAVDTAPYLLETVDGGATWERVPGNLLPSAGPGEGGFAASGTCARAAPDGSFWVATGAGGNARLLSLAPEGGDWRAQDIPVVRGNAAGLTTVAFGGAGSGLALGGDLGQMEGRTENIVVTSDGGRSWVAGGQLQLLGPVYGTDFVPGTQVAIAAGPAGADLTRDGGRSWASMAADSYWAVDLAASGVGWMVGPDGRVVRIALVG